MAPFFLPPALSPAAAATATALLAAFSSRATGTAAAADALLLLLLGSLSGGTLTAGICGAGRPRRGVGSLGGEKGALQAGKVEEGGRGVGRGVAERMQACGATRERCAKLCGIPPPHCPRARCRSAQHTCQQRRPPLPRAPPAAGPRCCQRRCHGPRRQP